MPRSATLVVGDGPQVARTEAESGAEGNGLPLQSHRFGS